ncbi:glycosyltransferase family 4 protein [Pelagerythrobacter sp.]|uniref:glycosyltransferase family 4 protein n=1 Tax=Pelagerythrobacter sp. TaxID=2800702 RepID=UPI0035B4761F
MIREKHRKQDIASGLSTAALHLAAKGRMSAIDIAQEAAALDRSPAILAARCKVSLNLYDIDSLKESVAAIEAVAGASGALESLLADIRSGPFAVQTLADRLLQRRPLALQPVPGRILYVLHKSLPEANDGYAMRSHGIAQGLLAQGADVVCATRPGFPSDLAAGKPSGYQLDHAEIVDGVHYHRMTSPMRGDAPAAAYEYMTYGSLAYLEGATARLAQLMRQHRPACVVAASNFATALPACLAAHELGLPFVYEVRGFWDLTRAARDPSYPLTITGRQERFLEAATARAAAHVITLTAPMRDELVARGVAPERITLAPNACDPERFSPASRDANLTQRFNLPSDIPIIGYVGSFNQYEGLSDLVHACGTLQKEGFDFRLLLVGSEPADEAGQFPVTQEIQLAAAKERLGDRLVMPGRVSHDEVSNWYSLIDIAPFPRRALPLTELVSPLKPLEALAMAKAVIVSSTGGILGMVRDGETGLVFKKDSVEALTDTLRMMLLDQAMRRRLGAAGRAWIVEQRSWRHAADEILGAVRPLVR